MCRRSLTGRLPTRGLTFQRVGTLDQFLDYGTVVRQHRVALYCPESNARIV